jgi:hypothetical protein
MTRHVHAMIAAGIVDGDAELIGHVFWSALHGLLMLRLAGKIDERAFERILHASMEMLSRGAGMKTPTPAKKRGRK